MDEKMKSTLLLVFCILIIVASFVGMQYVRSAYGQQTIELGDISFKAPTGYSYVNESYEKVDNGSNETSFHRILLKNQNNEIIEFTQYDSTLQLGDKALFDLNEVSIYKNITETFAPYSFNFNGKGYAIRTPHGYDNSLVEEIVKDMKVI